MSLFGKKVSVIVVFVGKLRENLPYTDSQYKSLLDPKSLRGIAQTQLAIKSQQNRGKSNPDLAELSLSFLANERMFTWYFDTWDKGTCFSNEVLDDVEKNGFTPYDLDRDKKRLESCIDLALIDRFGCTMILSIMVDRKNSKSQKVRRRMEGWNKRACA